MKDVSFIFIFQLISTLALSQVSGYVYDINGEVLPGASVVWQGTTIGTAADQNGFFQIEKPAATKFLIISYIGFKADTVLIAEDKKTIKAFLQPGSNLDEVVISERIKGNYISSIQPLKTEVISSKGLEKLACCNLSESFENNASVDINFSDALTGAKHIKMLGLDGKYAQILTENVPLIRGLSLLYGLNQVPGPWMESIQISKGTSSVVNGYEPITGQINLEIKKPHDSEPLYANVYSNSDLRAEANIISAKPFNEKLSTMILLHGSKNFMIMDENTDGFADLPLSGFVSASNRWDYEGEKMESKFYVNFFNENSLAGQTDYVKLADDTRFYGIDKHNSGVQLFSKTGFRILNPGTSIGIIAGYSFTSLNTKFGRNAYRGNQNYFYTNIIFRSYFVNTNHQYVTGISFSNDLYSELLNNIVQDKAEATPGLFGEYTYSGLSGLSLIAGARIDHNSKYGWLFTPRMHFKYNATEHLTLRGSAGRGFRSANIIAENMSYLASSRKIITEENFAIEEAWNYGVNANYDFHIGQRKVMSVSVDFYRTDFISQVIADMENPREVRFYNLNGKSYSNSFQAQASVDLIKQLEILLAFRMDDVKSTYNGVLLKKPLVNKYKGLLTLSYATKFDKWQFDFTGQYNGNKRLPDTGSNPDEYKLQPYSPVYYILHSQITRRFKYIEIYAGAENLLNVKQNSPVIAASDPFGPYFDASVVWGPVTGRMWYAGLRFKIK